MAAIPRSAAGTSCERRTRSRDFLPAAIGLILYHYSGKGNRPPVIAEESDDQGPMIDS
jgi:hypothetical protein